MRTKGWVIRSFIILAFLCFSILPIAAVAQTKISAAIPGTVVASTTNTAPGAFIANFYQFALMIGGILAFGVIVFGGIKYMASAGNPSGQTEGKEWIWGALTGLLLLAGAYLVLHTINPQLVNLTLPTLNQVVAVSSTPPVATNATSTPTSTCPLAALTPITDSAALQMEGGQTIIWTATTPNVQQNLTALQAAYTKFQAVIKTLGDTATLSSVYRPLAYQTHFYNIYQSAMKLSQDSSIATNPSCTAIVSALKAEEQKHGICKSGYPGSSTSACKVAVPSATSPHVAGIGIDITVSGKVSCAVGNCTTLNNALKSNNTGLQFQGVSNDPVHFQLTNPPGGSSASQ
jgi:hypothetical protein